VKKFLVLYMLAGGSWREQIHEATPEQRKEGRDAWMGWAKEMGAGLVEFGNPLGNSMQVVAGSSKPNQSQVAGFSILQADSSEAISGMLKAHPHFMSPDSSIEVHEFLPVPGM